MQYVRVAAGELKEKLLQTITNATLYVPLKECLETIGLTAARYHSWIRRQVKCLLPDQSTCPKLSPTKLTSKETLAIKELVTAKEYAHFSIYSLSMFAKRNQMVFASVSAWYRIARAFNLRRPGLRVYPAKPKIGIRALEPNQIWHVDVSIFRIVNGTKVYIQAIIDNASRYVLAWQVTHNYGGANTKSLIERALEVANRRSAKVFVPNLFADDGTENQNKDVESLAEAGRIIRRIAHDCTNCRRVLELDDRGSFPFAQTPLALHSLPDNIRSPLQCVGRVPYRSQQSNPPLCTWRSCAT
jgi:hypothetical protein